MADEQRRDQEEQAGSSASGDLEHCSENLAESSSAVAERIAFAPMRPEQDNIAAPDLPGGIAWIGEAPQSMPALTAPARSSSTSSTSRS